MIDREALARFSGNSAPHRTTEANGSAFDMDGFLSKHHFEVIQRKPWRSHPGGLVFELARCPFNSDHTAGSAAFTLAEGMPGFTCKHNGCHGKAIQDVFAIHRPQSSPGRVDVRDDGPDPFPSGTTLPQVDPLTEDLPQEPPEDRKPAQAQALIALTNEAKFFQTPEGESYAQLSVGQHKETWLLRSKGFRRWLMREFYRARGTPARAQALQDAISLLEAKAQFEGPEFPLFVRIAEHGGRIYIDLSNAKWQVVEITQQGWRVIADPPVFFRRAKGMQALPQPQMGGSLNLLRNLINVGDDDNWILCAAWLVAACRPKGPFPILILQGEQGSAKSTMEKFLRRIIDPSSALVRTPPREEKDLLIAAGNSWVMAYDNLSGIPPWLSDALCRLATGGGFSTRELYTDSDEVFFDATRPVVLNGIDHLAERADLADRALILNLPHIENEDRRDEAQLYADFERDLPQILGTLFTAVSAALARLAQTKLDNKPRMADFALWATAAEQELGFPSGAFMKAYLGNRAEAVQETLEADPLGAAVLGLMEKLGNQEKAPLWDGTCKELLSLLEQFVGDGIKSRTWPKTPRALSAGLGASLHSCGSPASGSLSTQRARKGKEP